MEDLQYPIGRPKAPETGNAAARLDAVKRIGALPEQLERLARDLHDRKLLDTPYRPGGWTAQQVIHHLADSHLHGYRRHKVTLLEEHPTLVPYDQQAWAEFPDVLAVPVQASVDILRGLHLRWAVLLAQCTDEQWSRTAYHPGSGITYHLDTLAAHYAWHGDHHLAHLQLILQGT
ncbi:YfiT family bacillithiol transferase [Neolewinella litorea]|uniref:Putative metal-dependent hydrolase n=1 Tax=Neolewinella litorea TaxID=2562452 RepID=A0A4S4NJF1_9BACT|nr:putative metal-dependent hydrolase [Neolewinella litorea]THH39889.1 putative metal-dependent hydrolase [Neolewinella litorea]